MILLSYNIKGNFVYYIIKIKFLNLKNQVQHLKLDYI